MFGHAIQSVEDTSAYQAKIARIKRDIDLYKPFQQAIEQRRRHFLESGLAGPPLALAEDYVSAAIHLLHHAAQKFWRVLKICVDNQNPLTATEGQAGGQSELMSVIARQIDRYEPRVAVCQLVHDAERTIAGTVVD